MPEVAQWQSTYVAFKLFTFETEPQELHDSVTVSLYTDYDCQLVHFPKGTRMSGCDSPLQAIVSPQTCRKATMGKIPVLVEVYTIHLPHMDTIMLK